MATLRVSHPDRATTIMEYLDGDESVGSFNVSTLTTYSEILDSAHEEWGITPFPWEDGGGWVHEGSGTLTIQVFKEQEDE